jgi:Na+:H+ antiporter, NhaA family
MSQNPGIPPRTAGGLEARLRESLVTRALIVPVQQFIHIQGVSSILLLLAAVAALVWANSPWHESYHHVWDLELRLGRLQLPVHAWINDALMTIFFFLVGMEIKHEIVHGELSDMRRASLPIFAALGGMIVPALIYAGINYRQEGAHGWGIPMATDIAFSLGVLAMVKGIPSELKVFLLSLAIADDIGAIAVIAIFYTETVRVKALIVGLLLLVIIYLVYRVGIQRPMLYAVLGVLFWVVILRSGIHATIAGVILGFMVPTTPRLSFAEFESIGTDAVKRYRDALAANDTATAARMLGVLEQVVSATEASSERLTRKLNDWVSFLVLPLFALANAGVEFSAGGFGDLLRSHVTWGVFFGLVLGKPLGIFAFSWAAVKSGIAKLPHHVSWSLVTAVGMLAGIGFTVSIFISSLAFGDPALLTDAKAAVLGASVVAGVVGYISLQRSAKAERQPAVAEAAAE